MHFIDRVYDKKVRESKANNPIETSDDRVDTPEDLEVPCMPEIIKCIRKRKYFKLNSCIKIKPYESSDSSLPPPQSVESGSGSDNETLSKKISIKHEIVEPLDPIIVHVDSVDISKNTESSMMDVQEEDPINEDKSTSYSSKAIDNGDLAFFYSILPMVRELNNVDKLTFRSEILNRLLTFVRS